MQQQCKQCQAGLHFQCVCAVVYNPDKQCDAQVHTRSLHWTLSIWSLLLYHKQRHSSEVNR